MELLKTSADISVAILKLANQGIPQKQFRLGVSALIREAVGCDSVALFIRNNGYSYYWDSEGGKATTMETSSGTDAGALRECAGLLENWPDGRVLTDRDCAIPGCAGFEDCTACCFGIDGEREGLLVFRSRKPGNSGRWPSEMYQCISDIFGQAVALRRAKEALRERIKESETVYRISRIFRRKSTLPDEQIYQEILDILPGAFQHPEAAEAYMMLDDRVFRSASAGNRACMSTAPSLVADLVVNGRKAGQVTVCYTRNLFEPEELTFLHEEEKLLASAAKQLALFMEERIKDRENRELQTQLRHSDRLSTIGGLSAGVAHELNEPLANIIGYTQLLQNENSFPESVERDMDRILKSAFNARDIVKKLLLFARKMPGKREEADINGIISGSLEFIQNRLGKKCIEVDFKPGENLPPVTVDPFQLQQVFVNLFVNSLQAMNGSGKLEIKTEKEHGAALISVTDTGCGIDKDIADRIFMPFFTTKDIGEGTGLGLSVVHGIISEHGGRISAEQNRDSGARFIIEIPFSNGALNEPET